MVVPAVDEVVFDEDVLARVYVDTIAVESRYVLAVDCSHPRNLDLHVVNVHVFAVSTQRYNREREREREREMRGHRENS